MESLKALSLELVKMIETLRYVTWWALTRLSMETARLTFTDKLRIRIICFFVAFRISYLVKPAPVVVNSSIWNFWIIDLTRRNCKARNIELLSLLGASTRVSGASQLICNLDILSHLIESVERLLLENLRGFAFELISMQICWAFGELPYLRIKTEIEFIKEDGLWCKKERTASHRNFLRLAPLRSS